MSEAKEMMLYDAIDMALEQSRRRIVYRNWVIVLGILNIITLIVLFGVIYG